MHRASPRPRHRVSSRAGRRFRPARSSSGRRHTARKPGRITQSLRTTFGLEQLRPGQREVILSVLAGKDTLALMPTGAGKSLCYQIPALHLEGITIVVSPLISLMKDQADKLLELGIDA